MLRRIWVWLNAGKQVRVPWLQGRRVALWQVPILVAVMLALVVLFPSARLADHHRGERGTAPGAGPADVSCARPYVVDGDTLRCGDVRIRLAGIDAPEMPGHCAPGRQCTPGDPFASRAYLQSLVADGIHCRRTDTDRYGRMVARCQSGGQDLSCAMIAAGHAVNRYGSISCPG